MNRIISRISNEINCGNNVVICGPRQSGKTHIISTLLDGILSDRNGIILAPQKAIADEVCRRVTSPRRKKFLSAKNLLSIRGLSDIDYVIIEEFSYIKNPEILYRTLEAFNCGIMLTMTPVVYDSHDPPLCRLLIEDPSVSVFNLPPPKRILNREDWPDDVWQTEVCGNWVAR